jgi:hypothetical protein
MYETDAMQFLSNDQIDQSVQDNKKKKDSLSKIKIFEEYSKVLDREPNSVFRDKTLKKKYHCYRESPFDKLPTVIHELDGICRTSSVYTISTELLQFLKRHAKGGTETYLKDSDFVKKGVEHWLTGKEQINEKPTTIAFKSDPRLAFHRLNFDPIRCALPDFEANAPTWNELLSRMSDPVAFCLRMGSLFDPCADRKQAIYISGPKDSGKSQIMVILGHIAGVDSDGGGAYTSLSNEDLDTPFWRGTLINRRVVCIGEASPKFLCTEAFKAITGDSWHNINEKNRPMFMGKLSCLLFFFSNDAPAIDSKPDLIERVIDIRISAVNKPRDELLGEVEYQKQLRAELPHFLGYCIEEYSKKPGKRIECNNKYLQETIDEKESESITLFENKYRMDSRAYIYKSCVSSYLRDSGIKENKIMHAVFHTWKRRYGIKSSTVQAYSQDDRKIKKISIWKGMREPFQDEITYAYEKEII